MLIAAVYGQKLGFKLPAQAGTGYGIYQGPCHVACWSPHQSALVSGLNRWQVTESEQVGFRPRAH